MGGEGERAVKDGIEVSGLNNQVNVGFLAQQAVNVIVISFDVLLSLVIVTVVPAIHSLIEHFVYQVYGPRTPSPPSRSLQPNEEDR